MIQIIEMGVRVDVFGVVGHKIKKYKFKIYWKDK